MPPELIPQFTTVEYTLVRATTMAPIFLFVVDTCVSKEELIALKVLAAFCNFQVQKCRILIFFF